MYDMIMLHVSLLVAVILTAIGLVAWRPGLFPRPLVRVLIPITPLLLIGIMCALMLSAYGAPLREWAVPALSILALGLFCRSERSFRYGTHAFLIAAIVLCWNFTRIMAPPFPYTADTVHAGGLTRAREQAEIAGAQKALRTISVVAPSFPEGPVSAILNEPKYDAVRHVTIQPEWHTPLTGLYRVRRAQGSLWYPGGDVLTASRRIEWRPSH
jgi:hypothetical protein